MTGPESSLAQSLRRLRRLHVELQIAHATVFVAAAALHRQNADRDEEIARVLEFCVGERLAEQIERTAELLASLASPPAHPNDLSSWDPDPRHGAIRDTGLPWRSGPERATVSRALMGGRQP